VPHDAHHLPSPGLLARERRERREPRPRPGRSVDWLRVGIWTAAVVISCAVWSGLGLALYALVVS
jgi:hypothetical protein